MPDTEMMLPTLWFENESGDRWVPPRGVLCRDESVPSSHPPSGYVYQWSRFPRELTTNVYLCGPDKSEQVAVMHESWSYDLVLCMVRPTLAERLRQILRYGRPAPAVTDLEQAILRVATACEGCLNVLMHRHGYVDGYRAGSEQHRRARALCDLCDPTKRLRQERDRQE